MATGSVPLQTPSRLLIVSAPSGAGKTTVCSGLRKSRPELALSVSTTTRPRRRGERDGVDYDFVDGATFDRLVAEGQFLEWAEVHGERYGTARPRVQALLDAGRSVLFDVDVQGAASLKAAFSEQARSVMLIPPSWDELERRLRGRGTDAEETIVRRLHNAQEELSHWRAFDGVVVNEDVEAAVARVEGFLVGEAPPQEPARRALASLLGEAATGVTPCR